MDEGTSATNLMVRDRHMQQLVPKHKEPITPFLDQARNLYREHGISTVADTVIAMDCYLPEVVIREAKRLASEDPSRRVDESQGRFGDPGQRILSP